MSMAWNGLLFVDMTQPSSYAELAVMNLDKRPVKGIVQPPVKPPEGKLHRNTNLLQFILNIVLDICKNNFSWPFRKPVDTFHLKIPDIFSMAKTIEKIFVKSMEKCTEMEVEIPMPIKPSKSKEGKREIASVKTETCDSKTWTTSANYRFAGNLKPSQCVASALSAFERTSQTYNQTPFMSTSQTNNPTTIVPPNQMNVTSQYWTCPRCHCHSEKPQYFMQKTSVGRKSIIRSSSCSSDSSSSSDDFEKEIEEMKERVKKLTEKLEHLVKEFIEDKKRKLERRKNRKLKKKLLYAPVVKQQTVCHNEFSLAAAIPNHSVSASTLSEKSKKLQRQKKPKKNSSEHILAPKPSVKTKKSALKRACSPKPAAQTKKRKIDCNPHKKQLKLPTPTCRPPPPISTAITNDNYRMKIKDANLKPMSYEEKSKLSDELSKLDENATAAVSTIIKFMEPQLYDAASTELVLDLDALKLSTLKELRKYVDNSKKQTQTSSSMDKNDSTHKTQNSSKEKKRNEYSDDDSTSSSSSSCSGGCSKSFLLNSDESSSSSNTSNYGKTNSANDQSTITTNATAATHPDFITSPVIVDKALAHSNTAFYFPSLQQTVKKSGPDFEECKSSFSGPSTSRPVLQLNNYTRTLNGPPKESTNRVGAIHTPEVDRPYGYTRITKSVEQAHKKAQQNQRLMDSVENAKRTMKMREKMKKQVQNKADQPRQEVKIEKHG